MSQLLVSVTSLAEAELAVRQGVDLLDLKNPAEGALGALPLSVTRDIVTALHGKKPISATIGDAPMRPESLLEKVMQLSSTQVDMIKIGFFPAEDYQSCLDALQQATQAGVALVAVLFAECHYPAGLLSAIKRAGFVGVMLDTMHKNGQTFLDYYSEAEAQDLAQQVLDLGLFFGLAGSLQSHHVATLKKIRPTYVGFRGGVCVENQRTQGLDAGRITAIRQLL